MNLTPAEDEIEISIFGPGYGECCVVHAGGGQWIIIDSCVDTESGRPVALTYLENIGVNPATGVKLIVASHWHDDHIRGISSVLRACTAARFCASGALNKEEFLAVLAAYDQSRSIRSGSGTREIIATLRILQERSSVSHPIRAAASRLLFRTSDSTGHGQHVEVWSLSPSDGQVEEFIKELGSLIPAVNQPRLRATPCSPNHLSVVTWVSIGSHALLFGADLEETGKPGFGWSSILESATRPSGKALFFKIPHHGSQTAHHDDTWRLLIEKEATCVLTPWNRSGTLPTHGDVTRLLNFTTRGYSTSRLTTKPKIQRPYTVEKQIRETTRHLRSTDVKTGHVRWRRRLASVSAPDAIHLSPEACRLVELLNILKGK